MMTETTLADLKPDTRNARKHNPRNIGMIVDSLHQVGAARSIVIDEDNVILAGNGVIEAAAEAGIMNVRIIEASGNEIIAVKRSGLTPEQKTKLALFDNRTAELADWDLDVLGELDIDLGDLFFDSELAEMGIDGLMIGETGAGDSGTGDEKDALGRQDMPESPIGSLVYRPALNQRHSVYFMSCRRWRDSTKQDDLERLKAAKRECDPTIVQAIARELAPIVLAFLGSAMTDSCAVTAAPVGVAATQGQGKHFATSIAMALAELLGLRFVKTFVDRPRTRASCPALWNKRGELQLLPEIEPCTGWIFIDDVATTATTVEECVMRLRELSGVGMVLPVVWLRQVVQE